MVNLYREFESSKQSSSVQNSVNLQNIQRPLLLLVKDREMDLQNVRKSPRLSMNSREMDLQNNFEYSEKGIKCRMESQSTGLDRHKLSFPTEVQLPNMPQAHNRSAYYDGETDLQNIRKSPSLLGKNREMNLQNVFEFSEKGIKCRTESHIKGPHMNDSSFPIEIDLANMPQVQNRSAEDYDGQMDLQNIRKSPRFLVKNRAIDLQNVFECSEKGIKCERESQRKGSIRNNVSFHIEVDLVTKPQFQNTSANYDGEMDLQNIRKSPQLLGRNRETNLQNIIECSEQGIKCISESQKKGSDRNKLSFPIEVVLANKPQVQNRSTNNDGEMNMLSIRKSPRLSDRNREMHLQNVSEFSDKMINCTQQSQKKGSERNNLSCPIEVELTIIPQFENGSPNYDVCLVDNANASSHKSFKSVPFFEYYVGSGKGINLIVDLNSSPSDWTKKRFENDMWCNSQNLQTKQFQSFRQEIECLGSNKMKSSLITSTGSVNKIRISPVENEASSKSVSSENCQVQSNLPDGDNGSLDVSESKSCSAATTGDGSLDNSHKVNSDTCGDYKSTCAEELERRIPITGTEASDPENSLSDGSRKRKRQGREINGVLLRSGMRLGARRSMRLSYKN